MDKKVKWKTYYGSSWCVAKNALRCISCKEVTDLTHCPNCGSPYYKEGISTDGVVGSFCEKCQKGFTRWSCSSCGTDNPVKGTIVERGGCFVASAVYGSSSAKEVLTLRTFRDRVLARSRMGRLFIIGYYHFAPFYAQFISKSEVLKKIVKITLIAPLVKILRSHYKEHVI